MPGVQIAVTLYTLAVAFVFTLAGMARVQGLPASDVVRQRLDLPVWLWRLVGAVELAGVLGLVVGVFAVPDLAVAAAVGFVVLAVLAIAAHARAGDLRPGAIAPVVMGAAAAVDAWLVASYVT